MRIVYHKPYISNDMYDVYKIVLFIELYIDGVFGVYYAHSLIGRLEQIVLLNSLENWKTSRVRTWK